MHRLSSPAWRGRGTAEGGGGGGKSLGLGSPLHQLRWSPSPATRGRMAARPLARAGRVQLPRPARREGQFAPRDPGMLLFTSSTAAAFSCVTIYGPTLITPEGAILYLLYIKGIITP